MKIDIINSVAPKKPKVQPEEGLSLSQQDSPLSLSSPFVNPYRQANKQYPTTGTKGKTAAERNNNPFNIKFGNFAARFGATKENRPALDGGSFATFPNVQAGLDAGKALLTGKNYRDLTVDQALRKWSNKGYGGEIFPEVANRTIASLNPRELDTLQRKQIVREDRKYAEKLGFLPKYKYGGKLPKYEYGSILGNYNNPLQNGLNQYTTPQALTGVINANTKIPPTVVGKTVSPNAGINTAGAVGMGLGLAGSALENFNAKPDKVNKGASIGAGALKGAGTGVAIGGTLGSVVPVLGNGVGAVVGGAVGAIAGGVTGLVKANKKQRLINQSISADQAAYNQLQTDRSQNLYRQYNPYQYKFGGNIPFVPEYEVEKSEVVQGDAILQNSKQIANGLQLVNGKTHEQGGSLGAGGDRVFSNSISLNGQTPASMAKTIGNKIAKFEPNLTSKDFMKRKTAEVMTAKLTNKLDEVFDAQEQVKIGFYKYGGKIPKMADGGTIEERRAAIKRRISTIDNYLKENPKRQAFGASDAKDKLRAERNQLQSQLDNSAIWKGEVFNPLDTTKNLLYPIKTVEGGTFAPATVKGKRTLSPPVIKKSVASKPNPTRTNITAEAIDNPIKPNFADPLVGGLTARAAKIPNSIPQAKTNNSIAQDQQRSKIDPTLAAGIGLAGIGYLNNAANINRMDTSAPANLISSPYYMYGDRSRIARADLSALGNQVLNNPNTSPAQKQAIFARVAQGMNQINEQENSNRFAYDNDFNNRDFATRAQNTAIVNQSIQQRIANQNNQIASRMDNFNNLLTNVNTVIAEQNARRAQDRRFSLLSNTYKNIYNTDFDIKQ